MNPEKPTLTVITNPRLVPVYHPECKNCGGIENIVVDVLAHWNRATGQAEVSAVLDDGHCCEDCGSSNIAWEPVYVPEKPPEPSP